MPEFQIYRAAEPDKDIKQILKEMEIIHLPKPIMEMSMKEIREFFGYDTGSIKMGVLMRNLIWQIYGQILAGNPPDFYAKQGFIRGMWYYIKKKFSKHHALRGDRYSLLVKNLTDMVKAGLFGYGDFNFRDPDGGTWKLGFDNPAIILIAEKDGFITIMEDLHKEYGCHVMTCGGIPSLMTVNYMVKAMQEFDIDITQPFHVVSFCDFDPSGYNVAETFVEHLQRSGIKNFHLFEQWGTGKKRRPWLELAVPANFDGDPQDFRYALPKRTWDDPSTKAWVKLTGGGLDGPKWVSGKKTHGLESDEFDLDLIKELYANALEPFLSMPSDDVKIINAFQELRQEIEQMAIVKFLQRLKEPAPEKDSVFNLQQLDIDFKIDPQTKKYSLTLSPQLGQEIFQISQKLGVQPGALIHQWLDEKLN